MQGLRTQIAGLVRRIAEKDGLKRAVRSAKSSAEVSAEIYLNELGLLAKPACWEAGKIVVRCLKEDLDTGEMLT